MKKYIFALALASTTLIPLAALAATYPAGSTGPFQPGDVVGGTIIGGPASASGNSSNCETPSDITTLFNYVLCLIVMVATPFLFGLGGLIFIIGVLTYVRAGDNEEKRAAGRDLMWFGIIALFVMLSVWGFVRILTRSFFGTDPAFQSLPKRATSVFAQ